jgi:EVE domain
MRTWIFQAHPGQFDIDRFLAAPPHECKWLVSRYESEIEVSDRVFIWRAIGNGDRSLAGIIAEAEITERAIPQSDDSTSRDFWFDWSEATRIDNRAVIRFVRVAAQGQHLVRADIMADPMLSQMDIVKVSNATNFKVSDQEASRLQSLWAKAGSSWSRSEIVAALLAYDKFLVDDLACQVGRSVSEARKKLASFNTFDPRSTLYSEVIPKSLESELWREFFDYERGVLRREALELERASI